MTFSHLPPSLTSIFHRLAAWLQRRTAASPTLVPPDRRVAVTCRASAAVPHQVATGRRATSLAAPAGRRALCRTLGGGRWRVRQAAVLAAGPPGGLRRGQPPAQGC